jgi:nucleoside-diphosphate-sugar epimerase|tara:strand:+ start:211 stop:1077 length:867 start_codon:yes stop_codon:yes gene_type:complete
LEKIIKKLIIVGCGRLGQKIGNNLSALPIQVIGIKRQLPKNTPSFRILSLDIFSDKFSESINQINPDFVIYCVSSDSQTEESYQKNYVEGLRTTIKILGQLDDFQHLFFVSSTRVYGQITKNCLSESINPQPSDYGGRALLEAEKYLKKALFKSTILRLSGIYGDDRRHMLGIASDIERWPSEDRWTNRIHEEDAVSFISFLLTQILNKKEIENLYLVTDNEPVSLYEVLKWIRSELGLSLDMIPDSNKINGKKLISKILPRLNFTFKHPNYKSGYAQMIDKIKKTID